MKFETIMKKDKNRGFWRRILATAVMLAVALSSCTQEFFDTDSLHSDQLQVQVVLPKSSVTRNTEPGNEDENRLEKIVILLFDNSGNLKNSVVIPNLSDPSVALEHPLWVTKNILNLPITKLDDPRNIYVIANWNRTDFDMNTYKETTLKEEITSATNLMELNGTKAYPMLMSGVKTGVTGSEVTIAIERQLAKVRATFTLSQVAQANSPNIEWLTDQLSITFSKVPNKSYVMRGNNNTENFISLNNAKFELTDAEDVTPPAGAQTFPATGDLVWKKQRVYVYESLPSDMGNATYIVVQLPYKNHTTGVEEVDNYYKLYVGEQKDAASATKVLRNTIYDLKIKILGLGMPFNDLVTDVNIEDQLTVIPWEEDNIDVEDTPNSYFSIDRTRVEFQYFAQTQTVYFDTDIYEPDWKLYNKADGSVFLSSTDTSGKKVTLNGIKYTLIQDTHENTGYITMEKAAEGEFPKTKQEFYFQVKNLKISFVVVYDNGFIPNSVLSKDFTVDDIDYQGWPIPVLPKTGLQVAKIGNVLPTGVAKADDPLMYWSNIYEDTGITATELGTGKSNYVQLKAKGAADYPIGQACEHLGPEWYVPSVDELVLIYNNKSTFGISYLFTDKKLYSTTTDHEKVARWCVDFENGKLISAYKTYTVRVRCVRNI